MESIVAIAYDESIDNSIPKCLDLLGDFGDIFSGKHVAVKPNDTWASAADLTPCTQADTVRAVIRYVKSYNPSKITVSGGAGAAETDDVFHILGIDKIISEEEVEYFDHNHPPFERVALEYGPQEDVMINPHILSYDTVISLAQLKVHNTATVTLTMKNIAMSYPAADYYGHPRSRRLHPHNFFSDMQSFITGMCKTFPIHLGIIVGHPAMTERGPIGGHAFDTGLVIASRDYVAADSVGAYFLEEEKVRHILEAEKQGLGNASLENIEIRGIPLEKATEIFREKSIAGSLR